VLISGLALLLAVTAIRLGNMPPEWGVTTVAKKGDLYVKR
jgi:hypothetical protein